MRIALILGGLLLAPWAFAHDDAPVPPPMELEVLLPLFGWDLKATKITSERVADGIDVLYGLGGNIVVSVGDDGVLIVDDQFPELMPRIRKAIRKLGGKKVDFAINTHWHFDHSAGNLVLGSTGTWLVAQANSRLMMQQDNVINLVAVSHEQKAYPQAALPVITFDRSMQFHFNGEQIDLLHFGPAHTTGDAAVLFRKANVVHMGDVFNNAGYPFIDAGNGGDLDGMIAFCRQVLATINADTVVVPGHGKVADQSTLVAYVEMLSTVRARIAALLKAGASKEAVFAAKVTAEFDAHYGDSQRLVDRAYTSLSHAHHKPNSQPQRRQNR